MKIQDLYLAGKKAEAMALVPDELVDEVALVGPKERIRDRLAAWKASPVTTHAARRRSARSAARCSRSSRSSAQSGGECATGSCGPRPHRRARQAAGLASVHVDGRVRGERRPDRGRARRGRAALRRRRALLSRRQLVVVGGVARPRPPAPRRGARTPGATRTATRALAGITHAPAAELAEALCGVAPPGLEHVFFSDDGSTAVEVALKLALQYWAQNGRPARTRFVALDGAFHGETLGATAIGGVEVFRRPFAGVLARMLPRAVARRSRRRAGARDRRARAMLLRREARHDRRASCVEPIVQGAAGMRIYDPAYLRAARELCDRHDVFLVADEVFTGYGRTRSDVGVRARGRRARSALHREGLHRAACCRWPRRSRPSASSTASSAAASAPSTTGTRSAATRSARRSRSRCCASTRTSSVLERARAEGGAHRRRLREARRAARRRAHARARHDRRARSRGRRRATSPTPAGASTTRRAAAAPTCGRSATWSTSRRRSTSPTPISTSCSAIVSESVAAVLGAGAGGPA